MFLDGVINAEFKAKGPLIYSKDADCIAIYWKGLANGIDDLRIDITRKFNGFPLP